MKTREELNLLKKEFLDLNNELSTLSEDELKQVVGEIQGNDNPSQDDPTGYQISERMRVQIRTLE